MGRVAMECRLLPNEKGELTTNFWLDAKLRYKLMGAPGRGKKEKTVGNRTRRTKQPFSSAQPWGPRTSPCAPNVEMPGD